MFVTISDISKTVNLQQYIDNRKRDKRIGLKSITYTIGWYNLIDQYFVKSGSEIYKIPNGYYSFQQIVEIFQFMNIFLDVDRPNGYVTLVSDAEVEISPKIEINVGI